MNLTKLFETQKVLDDRIVKGKGLEGQDLLPEKILALQVELGELANEWRGFKFWSEDREPRMKIAKQPTMNYDDIEWHNPVLEEYVDCLHFILSIGLELKEIAMKPIESFNYWSFEPRWSLVNEFSSLMTEFSDIDDDKEKYVRLFCTFIGLGEMLGFNWEQIEQAYYSKNKINHTRQSEGY